MAKDSREKAPAAPDQTAKLLDQIALLKKAVVLLLALCLAVSLTLNVYLGRENRGLLRSVSRHEEQMVGQEKVMRYLQRLVGDLRVLSKTNRDVEALLAKYHLPPEARLGAATHATPRPE